MTTTRLSMLGLVLAAGVATAGAAAEAPRAAEVYRAACATCHGADGRGVAPEVVAFAEPLPDFSDCGFATREPDADWFAVAHGGGPARAFSRMMPAFAGALPDRDVELAVAHVRTFCRDDAWPRGELNLPRPLVTEKAYPEDEAVYTVVVDAEGTGEIENEIVYERRLGARNQVELVVPFAWIERDGGGEEGWHGGVGDVAVAFKRAVYHSLARGSILSFTGEVVLPTGDEDRGFGSGHTVLEPFVTFGQILPADAFLQVQAGGEVPLASGADDEVFARLAVGRTWNEERYGRAWSPMLELLAARELASGADTHWDVVPQVQVTLSRRQHVRANLGVRVPLDDTATRDTKVIAYVLWDWFDGGLFAGWR